MRKFTYALTIMLLMAFSAMAQNAQSYPDDDIGFQPKLFETGLAKFYGDGRIVHGDLFFGVAYKTPKNIIYPQAGLSGNIFFDSSSDNTEGRVAFNLGFGFWDLFYVGGFYDFWQSGTGWQGPKDYDTGLTINVDLGALKDLAGL